MKRRHQIHKLLIDYWMEKVRRISIKTRPLKEQRRRYYLSKIDPPKMGLEKKVRLARLRQANLKF